MLADFKKVVLASQSPARRALLENMGIEVVARPQDCVEHTDETHPGKVVEALANLKLQSYLINEIPQPGVPVIASDTMLWFDGALIGKAHSPEEARAQISSLQGRTHQVYTGYAVYFDGRKNSGYDCAGVTFKPMDDAWIDSYVASNEWKGAAGSYHLYGKAVDFIESIEGDEATVIGLPIKKLNDIFNHQITSKNL